MTENEMPASNRKALVKKILSEHVSEQKSQKQQKNLPFLLNIFSKNKTFPIEIYLYFLLL